MKNEIGSQIFLLLGWIELEILILTVVLWFTIESEKVVKNEIESQKNFITGLDTLELENTILTVVFWFKIESEKVMKNEIGSQNFFIAGLDRA